MDAPAADPNHALAALRLLVEWGADEALEEAPVDRRGHPGAGQTGAQPMARPVPMPLAPTPPVPMPAERTLPPARPAPRAPTPPQADTVEELRAALLAFDGCALRTTAKSLAFADGNPAAGLVVVGEVPSDEDDRQGRPFSGPGGALLDRVFATAGLDRTTMLLTLLVPWRTPGKRPPFATEVAACLPFLQRHLFLLRPRRLVLLGGVVTRALGLGTEPIGRVRGAWRPVDVPGLGEVPALAMRPVETAMSSGSFKRDMWSDLMMLKTGLQEDVQAQPPL